MGRVVAEVLDDNYEFIQADSCSDRAGAFNGAYANFMYAFILCQDKDMDADRVALPITQFPRRASSLHRSIAAIANFMIFILCQKVIIGIVVPTEK